MDDLATPAHDKGRRDPSSWSMRVSACNDRLAAPDNRTSGCLMVSSPGRSSAGQLPLRTQLRRRGL